MSRSQNKEDQGVRQPDENNEEAIRMEKGNMEGEGIMSDTAASQQGESCLCGNMVSERLLLQIKF